MTTELRIELTGGRAVRERRHYSFVSGYGIPALAAARTVDAAAAAVRAALLDPDRPFNFSPAEVEALLHPDNGHVLAVQESDDRGWRTIDARVPVVGDALVDIALKARGHTVRVTPDVADPADTVRAAFADVVHVSEDVERRAAPPWWVERRELAVPVSEAVVLTLLGFGPPPPAGCVYRVRFRDLPPDVEVRRVVHDPLNREFRLLVSHPTFRVTPPGCATEGGRMHGPRLEAVRLAPDPTTDSSDPR